VLARKDDNAYTSLHAALWRDTLDVLQVCTDMAPGSSISLHSTNTDGDVGDPLLMARIHVYPYSCTPATSPKLWPLFGCLQFGCSLQVTHTDRGIVEIDLLFLLLCRFDPSVLL
jgi:hypothetical protein